MENKIDILTDPRKTTEEQYNNTVQSIMQAMRKRSVLSEKTISDFGKMRAKTWSKFKSGETDIVGYQRDTMTDRLMCFMKDTEVTSKLKTKCGKPLPEHYINHIVGNWLGELRRFDGFYGEAMYTRSYKDFNKVLTECFKAAMDKTREFQKKMTDNALSGIPDGGVEPKDIGAFAVDTSQAELFTDKP